MSRVQNVEVHIPCSAVSGLFVRWVSFPWAQIQSTASCPEKRAIFHSEFWPLRKLSSKTAIFGARNYILGEDLRAKFEHRPNLLCPTLFYSSLLETDNVVSFSLTFVTNDSAASDPRQFNGRPHACRRVDIVASFIRRVSTSRCTGPSTRIARQLRHSTYVRQP